MNTITLPQAAVDAINAVDSIEDYNLQMEKFKLSPAPDDVKDEAVRQLRTSKPQFDTSDKAPSAELLKQIKEGEADISDMGGMN